MPKLIEYVTVGICSSYGDGDYAVSSTVANLSPESYKELRLGMMGAICCMHEMWMRAQMEKSPAAQAKSAQPVIGQIDSTNK